MTDLLAEQDDQVAAEVLRALCPAQALAVPHILGALKSKGLSQGAFENLLLALGRIGPEARQAIPFLSKKLTDQTLDPQLRVRIRVVLHNLGYSLKESIAHLHAHILKRNDLGETALVTMAFTGSLEWVPPDTIQAITSWVTDSPKPPSDVYLPATIVLARVGTHTKHQNAAAIKKAVEHLASQDASDVFLGLALAVVDVKRRRDHLRVAMKAVGAGEFSGKGFVALAYAGPIIVTPGIHAGLVGLLDDRDPEVVLGAIQALKTVAMPGSDVANNMLQIMKASTNSDLRRAAADSLGLLLDAADSDELEKLLKQEKSEVVRERIRQSIRIMRLKPSSEPKERVFMGPNLRPGVVVQ